MSKELEILDRKLQRAILARKEAEKLLEKKSLELYASNQELKDLNNKLETLVDERTKELKNNEKYLKTIHQFASLVLKHHTIDEIVWEVINLMVRDLGFEDCAIYLFDEDKENLVQRAAFRSQQSDRESLKNPVLIPLGMGIVGAVAKTGLPELIADTSKDPRYLFEGQIRLSELAVPIVADGEVIGVIDTKHPQKQYFNQEHLDKLEPISGLVSSRMKNAISQEKLLSTQVSLKKLSIAVEQSPLSIFITDTKGVIEFVNPAFIETTGYSAEESIGQNSNILKSGKQTQEFYAELWKTIKEGKKWEGEIVNKRKNGEFIWVINSISPIKDNNERIINYVAIQADISTRKKLETDLIKEKDSAEKANKAKSEFLANMSHEIRTPMNAILGLSEALYYKLDSSQHQKMLATVLNSGKLLLSLLNDILDLSKIEAGMMELTSHPSNLLSVIEEIKLLYKETINAEKVEINIFKSADFPDYLIIDEIRMKQVIFNLVGNAIKFTHQGHVNIKLNFTYEQNHHGELLIQIEDTGIGIAKPQQKVIFQAFKQEAQSGINYGGAGLGLSISQRLITKMKGIIKVESELGKGSVFTVRFPDIEIPSSLNEIEYPKFENEDIIFEKASVLVVDDVPSNIETVESLLSPYNLKIMSAENGEKALQILSQIEPPDLILLDIQMPGLNGCDLAKKIKANPTLMHVPIVAFSATVLAPEKLSKDGFDGFLLKPFSRYEMVTELGRFLTHKVANKEQVLKQFWMIGPEDVSDELHDTLLQIIENLEEIVPFWETIKDNFVLYKIEQFAERLKQIAETYHFQWLLDYSNQLIEDIITVDLSAIQEKIKRYPQLIQDLYQLVKK